MDYTYGDYVKSTCDLEDKSILLIGYKGFLGQAFKTYLEKLGCHLTCIDKEQDITKSLPKIKAHYIISAAGNASPYLYRKLPLETMDVSYLGTRNILELAKNTGATVLSFSSSEVYGNPTVVPTPESYVGAIDTFGERSCYDIGKLSLETLSHIYATKYGVDVKVIRPFNVYGPGMSPNDGRVLPNFIKAAKANKPILVYDSGEQTRTFCYVDDFIDGAIRILLSGDRLPYNCGNDSPEISILELANYLQEAIGKKLDIRTVPYPNVYPVGEPRRRCPDLSKIKTLGYLPKISLQDGIKRCLAC